MTKEIIKNALFKHYNVNNNLEFMALTGFSVEITNTYGWRTSSIEMYIHLSFADKFYYAMTQPSSITIPENMTEKEIVEEFLLKSKYKIKQRSRLDFLKRKTILEIKNYFSKCFFIDPSIIKDEHIIFEKNKRFHICGVAKLYDAQISNDGITISDSYYSKDGANVLEFNKLYKFYFDKEVDSITGFKFIEHG